MKKTMWTTLFLLIVALAVPTVALAAGGSGGADSAIGVLGSFIIGLVVAFSVTAGMKKQLKSVQFRDSASFYVDQGSLKVTKSKELYLGSHVVRRPIAQNHGGGGHRGGRPGGGHRGGGRR